MHIHALIVAAGQGTRAGGALPKQYQRLAGQPILRRTLNAFSAHPDVTAVTAVIASGHDALFAEASAGIAKLSAPVLGGAERQVSVRLGLEALAPLQPDVVLIHDAARPFVSRETIRSVIDAAKQHGGAIAALPVTDTLKREAVGGTIGETVSRENLWRAQTPQGFAFDQILRVHRDFADRQDMTDDASLFEAAGYSVALVEDDVQNMKITRPGDFAVAERLLEADMEQRVGSGFDVHAFEDGDHVTVCGVDIPHTHGLKGHSDADVGMHALTDAIYGALSDGDIGKHFPPSEEQWKGAASSVFLEHAIGLVRERGGKFLHADVTIMCEMPKIGPHREAMRARLAEIMDVPVGRIAVKATTTESLGFTGRREGMAAQAVATIKIPETD